MKKLNKAILTAIVLFAFACSSKESHMDMEATSANDISKFKSPPPPMDSKDASSEAGGIRSETAPTPVFERKLIKNGDVAFKTKSLAETKKQIQAALIGANGYIAKETVYDYSNSPTEELTVRVPSKDFDKFLERILEGAEELDSKHIDIQDVSEEFVDIEARLKNKKQLEDKYKELLAKATQMDDILRIEKEISYIREEIESTEGRLRYLSNQVSYSTLQIRYYENRPSAFNFGGKLGEALGNGGTGFLWFIIVMVQLWPLWLIGGLLWWFIVWLIRRNRKK